MFRERSRKSRLPEVCEVLLHLTRRQSLKLLAAGTSAAALGLYTWAIGPHWLEFTYPDLPIVGLPHELGGRTLAQISDLHVGPKVDDVYIIKSLQRAGELMLDFVVFTGDWITYRDSRQFNQLRQIMPHIPHGRLGTVGILGNHDYGFNWRMVDVAQRVTEIVASEGVILLRNQALSVAGLQFLGLDDSSLSQSQCRRSLRLGTVSRLDPGRAHSRGPVQTTVPAATTSTGEEQTLYRR